MRIQHNTFSNAVQGNPILSIRKSAACGKHAAGYRENNANELMTETTLSIRGDLCVASTPVALGETPAVLSIRSDSCVASTRIAMSEKLDVLSIRSGFGVASAKTAMSYGS